MTPLDLCYPPPIINPPTGGLCHENPRPRPYRPPPPAIRGLISGAIFALALFAAPPAEAQIPLLFQFTTSENIVDERAGTVNISFRVFQGTRGASTVITYSFLAGDRPAIGEADRNGAGADFTDPGGGSITFAAADSLAIPVTLIDDSIEESAEEFRLRIDTIDGRAACHGQSPGCGPRHVTIIRIGPSDRGTATVTGPSTAAEGMPAEYTVTLSRTFAFALNLTWSVAHGGTDAADFSAAGGSVTVAANQASATFTLTIADDGAAEDAESFTVNVAVPSYLNAGPAAATTIEASGSGTMPPVVPVMPPPAPADNPVARATGVKTPLAGAAKAAAQLTAQVIAQRTSAADLAENSLTIAGRGFAGAEALAAEVLAGGFTDDSAMELLRSSGFNLTGGGDGRGFNFWGSGGYVSAEGKHDGVDYDGDTSAFTLGIDTGWRDGLIGVAVSSSDGDVDFTVKADGMESTLETTVTSVHPYLTRRFNRSQLWLTAGHGSGDAELNEKAQNTVIKTDVTVTTAGLGLTRAHGQLSGDISALYTRAELDAAASGGRALPKTTADSLRVAASGKARWQRGAFSPFIDFTVRHDSGDGDTGIAGDVGGGIEFRAPTLLVRLAAATTVSAEAAEETRASLTVRKSSGDFDLGLNLSADDSGFDTGRLLTGEWRF